MPSADVLAQVAAIIAGLTGLFTAVAAVFQHRRGDAIKATVEKTAADLVTGNGRTPGEILTKSDAVADAVIDATKPTTGA